MKALDGALETKAKARAFIVIRIYNGRGSKGQLKDMGGDLETKAQARASSLLVIIMVGVVRAS